MKTTEGPLKTDWKQRWRLSCNNNNINNRILSAWTCLLANIVNINATTVRLKIKFLNSQIYNWFPPGERPSWDCSNACWGCSKEEEEGPPVRPPQHQDQAIAGELQSYLQREILDAEEDPLKWCTESQRLYPRLSNLPRKHLCIPVPLQRGSLVHVETVSPACVHPLNQIMLTDWCFWLKPYKRLY